MLTVLSMGWMVNPYLLLGTAGCSAGPEDRLFPLRRKKVLASFPPFIMLPVYHLYGFPFAI